MDRARMVCWCLLLWLAVCRADAGAIFSKEEAAWIRQHPVVEYAIDPYWPFEFVENGQHRGLTREYLDAIAKISGLTFKMQPTRSREDSVAKIQRGDIYFSTAASSWQEPDVGSLLLLTNAYLFSDTVVVTRSSTGMLLDPNKLIRYRVAVMGGGWFERDLRAHYPNIELVLVSDPVQALAALQRGEVYAVVGLDMVLRPIIQHAYLGTLNIAGSLPEMDSSIKMAVSPRYPLLQSILNKSLEQLTEEDTDHIYFHWIKQANIGRPSWQVVLYHFSWELSAIAMLLATIVALLWRARRAERRAIASEADKSSFLAVMSHEIRTPMNVVLAAIDLLERTSQTARQGELTQLARSASVNLLELLNDVLDASRLEARGLQLVPEPLDLAVLVQGVADSEALEAERKGLGFSLEMQGLEGWLLLLDPLRTRQILTNLLSNAVKFTEKGGVALSVRLESDNASLGNLTIVASDTGIGISASDQARLFKAYSQADSTTSRRYGGSGLGLSICKQLVEMMGGEIKLESELGRGTQVSLSLLVQLRETDAELSAGAAAVDLTLRMAGRVLVVEDMEMNRKVLQQQLTELGCDSTLLGSGTQALEWLEGGGAAT
ncbi:ATP-binding protein, partial [Chromobacterium haemolyticum]|uniref:ATP-binding protein n=1 Tax=Chromobacterium haemolyticum TaxID=394935 RepID=UPI00307DC9EB